MALYLRKSNRLKTSVQSTNNMQNCQNYINTIINKSRQSMKSINPRRKVQIPTLAKIDAGRYADNLHRQSRLNFKSSRKNTSTLLKKNLNNKTNIEKIDNNYFNALDITTKSWCLFDFTNKKSLGFREDYKREIASLTKIMTATVSIEIMQKLSISKDCLIRVTENAYNSIGTSAELKKNHWVSLESLLYGTMLPSGNDAAYSLAEYLGYCLIETKKPESIQFRNFDKIDLTRQPTSQYVLQFIQQMNMVANKLGLINTRFSNPHGLQNAMNTSSAKDIMSLSVYAYRNKTLRKIANTIFYEYQSYQHSNYGRMCTRKWENTNKLLGKGWEGIKTGHTISAGSCLSSVRQGVFIVVLNCSSYQARFTDTEKIYDWYKSNYPQFNNGQYCQKLLNLRCESAKATKASSVDKYF